MESEGKSEPIKDRSSETEKTTIAAFSPVFDLFVELDTSDSGTETLVILKVYSAALKAVSPVWQKILDPKSPFGAPKERSAGDGRSLGVLHIDEVSISAAEIFFNVIHHNLENIPRTITFYQMVDVTKLVDQYDCRNIFQLWAECWVKTLHGDTAFARDSRWFFVANVFRGIAECKPICDVMFKDMCLNMIDGTLGIKPGQLQVADLNGKLTSLDICLVPDWILDQLHQQRAETFEAVIDQVRSFAGRVLNGGRSSPCGHKVCQYMIVGSFYRWMNENNMTFVSHSRGTPPRHLTVSILSHAVSQLIICTASKYGSTQYGGNTSFHIDVMHWEGGEAVANDYRISYDHNESLGINTCPFSIQTKNFQEQVKQLVEKIEELPL